MARGRRLKAFPGRSIRPTTDRVRESIFDLIGPEGPGQKVLDLFAGTGALGIEAASRGAPLVLLVDSARPAIQLIHENTSACGLSAQVRVVRMDVFRYLERIDPVAPFDLILMDPPYGERWVPKCLSLLARKDWLHAKSRLFCETEAGASVDQTYGRLFLSRSRKYGDTEVFEFLVG
jgi:16S rRNA (guanine(966)-N(2))-methyltransferase RsmD